MPKNDTFTNLRSEHEPVANVRAHGAVGDGVADDTTAVTDAIAASSGIVYFPPGTYLVTGPIDMPAGIRFQGDGPENSAVVFNGTTGFQTNLRVDNWSIRGLHIEDGGAGAETVGIDAQAYSSYYTIENCRIEGFGSFGLHHSGLAWEVSNVRFRANGERTTGESASVRLANRAQVPTTGQYERVYLKNGGVHGYLLTNSRQIFLSNCICEYHDIAFRAEDCNSIFVRGFWPEANTNADPIQAHDSNVSWESDVGPKPVHTWNGAAFARRYPTTADRLDLQYRDVTVGRELHAPENPSITPVVATHEDNAATQGVSHTFSSLPAEADKLVLEGIYSRTATGFGELNVQLNGITTADYASLDKDGVSRTRAYWPVVRVGQETSGVPFRVEIGTADGTISATSGGASGEAAVSGYLPGVVGLSSVSISSAGDTYADGTVDCTLLSYG